MTRNCSLDFLKLMMAFMIVCLHTGFLSDISELAHYLTVNGIFRICVPVFLLINGYYFCFVIEKKQQVKWFKRIFILYLFWMLAYSFYWLGDFSLDFNFFVKFIARLILGYYHLWYVSGLIVAGLLLCLTLKIPRFNWTSIIFILFLVGLFIQYFGSYQLFAHSILNKVALWDFSHRNAVFISFPFFYLGYYINKCSIEKSLSLKFVVFGVVLGTALLLLESYWNYIQPNRQGHGFDNYVSLILICPFLFLLFLKMEVQGKSKWLALISQGVFFIHVMVYLILNQMTNLTGTTMTLAVLIMSILMSCVLIAVNKKLRFIL